MLKDTLERTRWKINLTLVTVLMSMIGIIDAQNPVPVVMMTKNIYLIDKTGNPAIKALVTSFVTDSRDSARLGIYEGEPDEDSDDCGKCMKYYLVYSQNLNPKSIVLAYVLKREVFRDQDTIYINPYVPAIDDFDFLKHEIAHLLGYDHVNMRGHWLSAELSRNKKKKYICSKDVDIFSRFKIVQGNGTDRKTNR